MLSRLQVKNYVLIDSLEIDFPEGLIIITGQTGAGKSILMGALGLVMGAKADASMLSEGAENCVVEAEFDTDADDVYLRTLFEENDVEWDDGHIIVRRLVNRSGRSRAFVNDSPVPLHVLQEISVKLVDIHSQHQTLMLSDKRFQLETLDFFAGAVGKRQECSELWSRLLDLKSELAVLDQRIAKLADERDYNEAQFRQLEAASLKEGELEELEDEQKQLANAEEIKTGLCSAIGMFSLSSDTDGMSVDSALKEACKALTRVGRYVPAANDLSERLDSCRLELDDVLSDIVHLDSRTEVSDVRLAEVEDRMSLLYSLLQKHGCRTVGELIALRESLSEVLFDSTALEERRAELSDRMAELSQRLDSVADDLHELRVKAAPEFSGSITEAIRSLELPYAVFEVGIMPAPVGASGRDSIQFTFSSAGRNPVDVSKCASGGELSRIMLALKQMRARFAHMPTMVFDEIDTGVSGSVADKMGSMICSMGSYMQVFAITHLPQVAAKGKAHYLVSKDIDPSTSKAVSTIKKLSDEQRVMEVARMLSGSVMTDAAIANAKDLLGA